MRVVLTPPQHIWVAHLINSLKSDTSPNTVHWIRLLYFHIFLEFFHRNT